MARKHCFGWLISLHENQIQKLQRGRPRLSSSLVVVVGCFPPIMPRSALQNIATVVEQQQQPRKKTKIMGASGQTDEDRRALRHNLRLLHKEISAKAEQMENPTSGVFEQVREKSNGLFANAKYTREAVLDGDNLEAISAHAARQVERLVQVRFILTAVR